MKPMLFSTPMVRAILNTKPGAWPAEPVDPEKPFKWQTRRIVKPQPVEIGGSGGAHAWRNGHYSAGSQLLPIHLGKTSPRKVFDILWVRETHRRLDFDDFTNEIWLQYAADGECRDVLFNKERFDRFKAYDGPVWRPSIHMPREAARLFLEVKNARVERLHDIIKAEADAKAEGAELMYLCGRNPGLKNPVCSLNKNSCYVCAFKDMWDSLNAKSGYPWLDNPYVYVYEFTRLAPEEAQAKGAAV